jgi:hypothetical protein
MPFRARLDKAKIRRETRILCTEHLQAHYEAVAKSDRRILKRIKEGFFGKNTWSHHKVRLGRQVAGVVWAFAKKAVPGGDVADLVRQGVDTAGNLYLGSKVEGGKPVPTWAKDLFGVDTSQVHAKTLVLHEHLESILLWQSQFAKAPSGGLETEKQQLHLIKSYTKLLHHYKKAAQVARELQTIMRDEYQKLETYHEVWALEHADTSPIYAALSDILAGVLFDAEVHNLQCAEDDCYFGKRAFDIMALYSDFFELDPITPGRVRVLYDSYLTPANLAAFSIHQMALSVQTRRLDPGPYRSSVRLFPGSARIKPHDWIEFSKISVFLLGDNRGGETQEIDRAVANYIGAMEAQLDVVRETPEADLNTSVAARLSIRDVLETRIVELGKLAQATGDFIQAKSANQKSQRRPFVQWLDLLVQMEMEDLAICWTDVNPS